MAGVFGDLRGFNEYYGPTRGIAGHHFYTAFPQNEVKMNEFNLLIPNTWYLFSSSSATSAAGTLTPVYRFYKDGAGHFYTTSLSEKSTAESIGYEYEGIIGYAYPGSGSYRIPVYRYYSVSQNNYWYPTNTNGFSGYTFQGIAWYSPIKVSGCRDPLASNYNQYANQTSSGCIYPVPPSISTFSISPSSICAGSTATLSWSVSGDVSNVFINQGIGSVSTSGSRTIGPSSTTSYTLTASGAGGTVSSVSTLTVYQPSSTNLTVDNTIIIRGQSTTLRWITTGDATGATINNGIGPVNINGNRVISPTETTTYTINVTGICTNPSSTVTVTVYQPPTVNLTGPVSLNYGQQGTLQYQATDADISLRITPTYNYRGPAVTGPVVNLPTGASVSGQLTTQIPYNDIGPFNVTYVIVATGNGGQETKQVTIPINIDETPNNFLVPESEDLFKEQAPIFTPDAVATSYKIVIEDIDIPVEVKADKPILIDKNEQQNWKRIRRI